LGDCRAIAFGVQNVLIFKILSTFILGKNKTEQLLKIQNDGII
jgi:hypothetical protein